MVLNAWPVPLGQAGATNVAVHREAGQSVLIMYAKVQIMVSYVIERQMFNNLFLAYIHRETYCRDPSVRYCKINRHFQEMLGASVTLGTFCRIYGWSQFP